MLQVKGHLGPQSLPGTFDLWVSGTPTGFVGGQLLVRTANGLTLALSYVAASKGAAGLARYSEATCLADANGMTTGVKASIVRDAVGIYISKGTDPQTQLVDAYCPYDTTKTYAKGDPLYIKAGYGLITNAIADAGSSPIQLGQVITPPTSPSTGTVMEIHIFADLV